MPGAGQLRDRVSFYRLTEADDGYGNVHSGWADDPFLTVWGAFQPERGRERLEAGRMESAVAGVLTVRSSADARAVTPADKVAVKGEDYAIRSITNPDRRNRFLEILVERGVAP
tara:strand:- start:305 stop:646 length:342 start_codon:yes stop_codon:yes gene_type:complete